MKFEIYHQLGHRYSWNIDSNHNENTGNGVILSPKYMAKSKVENLAIEIRNRAIFDPQILNPSEINKNMSTYDFHPSKVMPNGFNTGKYSEYSLVCANGCIDFQITNNFRFLIIPTRYFNGIPSVADFIEFQDEQYINPFLTYIKNKGLSKDLVVQVVLNSSMIKNPDYASELLNWITGIEGIKGVYLITELLPRNKQIDDPDFLYSLLNFINALYINELAVILGYLNTEALLLSIANPSIMTIGSFENLRCFNSRMFRNMSEKNEQRPPTPRVFVPKLLDWIEYHYITLINKKLPTYLEFSSNNKYKDIILDPTYEWNFNKPEPYKHFFIEGSKQLRDVNALDDEARYVKVCDIIETAIQGYTELEKAGIRLDGYGSNLPKWLTAANLFASDRGWRK
jgi:hypothetical protein